MCVCVCVCVCECVSVCVCLFLCVCVCCAWRKWNAIGNLITLPGVRGGSVGVRGGSVSTNAQISLHFLHERPSVEISLHFLHERPSSTNAEISLHFHPEYLIINRKLSSVMRTKHNLISFFWVLSPQSDFFYRKSNIQNRCLRRKCNTVFYCIALSFFEIHHSWQISFDVPSQMFDLRHSFTDKKQKLPYSLTLFSSPISNARFLLISHLKLVMYDTHSFFWNKQITHPLILFLIPISNVIFFFEFPISNRWCKTLIFFFETKKSLVH